MISTSTSTAKEQRCLYCGATFPLYPPVIGGCPQCAEGDFLAPLEIAYDYPSSADWLPDFVAPGLARYAPMLPPIVESVSMLEGATPLVPFSSPSLDDGLDVYIKNESQNPTWSHKDRLNLMIVSAALAVEAPGIVAASSGNHGAAAAAYASRAGLPAVILTTTRLPAVASFLNAYGQLVVAVPDPQTRWDLLAKLVDEFGYHPASNQTTPPTNHPFGSESYKTIAYELFLQLDRRAPEAVFVPTGYAELFFGVHKGFVELQSYGLIETLPRMIACEPDAGAPLKKAIEDDVPMASVATDATDAYAIAVPVNSYRGVLAVKDSNGAALALSEEATQAANIEMNHAGIWAEFSAAISVAGLAHAAELGLGSGPIVCINTSSGFKDVSVGAEPLTEIDGSWDSLVKEMKAGGLL